MQWPTAVQKVLKFSGATHEIKNLASNDARAALGAARGDQPLDDVDQPRPLGAKDHLERDAEKAMSGFPI